MGALFRKGGKEEVSGRNSQGWKRRGFCFTGYRQGSQTTFWKNVRPTASKSPKPPSPGISLISRGRTCVVRNSEFYSKSAITFVSNHERISQTLDNCVMTGEYPLFIGYNRTGQKGQISLTHNTFLAASHGFSFGTAGEPTVPGDDSVCIEAAGNIYDVPALFYFAGWLSLLEKDKLSSDADAEKVLRRVLQWTGRSNLYQPNLGFYWMQVVKSDTSHEQADFLNAPAVNRPVEERGGLATTDPDDGPIDGDAARGSFAFLAPSEKPGSLGRLGHYEALEVIGRGGMGVVLRAFDDQLHRIVAIKVMAGSMSANGAARKRFVREARAAAAIRNEHVTAIYAVEEAAKAPYLVMEYIAGVSPFSSPCTT